MSEERRPCYAKCGKCAHVFVFAFVPMELGKFVRTMKRATCPQCAATGKNLFVCEPGVAPAEARA